MYPFSVFTSLRYDRQLLRSEENSSDGLSISSPSPFYMLAYHRDRLFEAARYFDFDAVFERLKDAAALEEMMLERIKGCQEVVDNDGPFKVRVAFNSDGYEEIQISSIPPVPLSSLYPTTLDPPPTTSPQPAKAFNPSPRTGGALTLGPTVHPAGSLSDHQLSPWTLILDTQPTPSTAHTSLKTTSRDHYSAARHRAGIRQPSESKEVIMYDSNGKITEGSLTSVYFFRNGRWVTPPVGGPDEIGRGGQRGTTRRWALSRGLCVEEDVEVGSVKVGEGVWISNGVRGFIFGRIGRDIRKS